jgi:hypothetical protein
MANTTILQVFQWDKCRIAGSRTEHALVGKAKPPRRQGRQL